MDLWAAWNEIHFAQLGLDDENIPPPPFAHHLDLHATVDATSLGDVPWQSFEASFPGEVGTSAPSWKSAKHTIWYRDPREVVRSLLDNPDFDGEFDYVPFQEFDTSGHRHYRDFFSGNWVFRQCVRHYTFLIEVLLLTSSCSDGDRERQGHRFGWGHVCPDDLRQRQDDGLSCNWE